MTPLSPKKFLIAALVCGWLGALGGGVWKLCAYSFALGKAGVAPSSWPIDAVRLDQRGNSTAVLALHPECECSTATLAELEDIVIHCGGKLQVAILFVQLPGMPPVEASDLWRRASRIAGVQLIKDAGGRQARLLGARTSGELSLYSANGQLQFHGGITLARGHVGANPGASAVLAHLNADRSASLPATTPVFGCALWDECAAPTL